MLSYLLVGLGVAIVLEGVAYALAPTGMKRFMAQMMETPPEQLRLAGLCLLGIGVIIVWWVLRSAG